MKIVSIVGARPQFIKAAMVSRQLRARGLEECLLHTGQHYDFNMSEVFFRELDLPAPGYCLGVGSGRHGEQTAKMLSGIEDVLLSEKPDGVIVYGDTNTTLAGALAAVKLHVPVAHVEAGLRSGNRQMPEEINRIVADRCSDVLFCPTANATRNLTREGLEHVVAQGALIAVSDVPPDANAQPPVVINVGDVMLDIARQASQCMDMGPNGPAQALERYHVRSGQYVLATIHRAGNTDQSDRLRSIMDALAQIASAGPKVLFPAHPRTTEALEKLGFLAAPADRLSIVDPVSYMEMVALERHAGAILTDSGGVQKEAYFFGVPCVVARDETEWTELVEMGWNTLAGADTDRIVAAVKVALERCSDSRERPEFYGDGHAAERIAGVLAAVL